MVHREQKRWPYKERGQKMPLNAQRANEQMRCSCAVGIIGKTYFWLRKNHVNAPSSQNNKSESLRKSWKASFRVIYLLFYYLLYISYMIHFLCSSLSLQYWKTAVHLLLKCSEQQTGNHRPRCSHIPTWRTTFGLRKWDQSEEHTNAGWDKSWDREK